MEGGRRMAAEQWREREQRKDGGMEGGVMQDVHQRSCPMYLVALGHNISDD